MTATWNSLLDEQWVSDRLGIVTLPYDYVAVEDPGDPGWEPGSSGISVNWPVPAGYNVTKVRAAGAVTSSHASSGDVNFYLDDYIAPVAYATGTNDLTLAETAYFVADGNSAYFDLDTDNLTPGLPEATYAMTQLDFFIEPVGGGAGEWVSALDGPWEAYGDLGDYEDVDLPVTRMAVYVDIPPELDPNFLTKVRVAVTAEAEVADSAVVRLIAFYGQEIGSSHTEELAFAALEDGVPVPISGEFDITDRPLYKLGLVIENPDGPDVTAEFAATQLDLLLDVPDFFGIQDSGAALFVGNTANDGLSLRWDGNYLVAEALDTPSFELIWAQAKAVVRITPTEYFAQGDNGEGYGAARFEINPNGLDPITVENTSVNMADWGASAVESFTPPSVVAFVPSDADDVGVRYNPATSNDLAINEAFRFLVEVDYDGGGGGGATLFWQQKVGVEEHAVDSGGGGAADTAIEMLGVGTNTHSSSPGACYMRAQGTNLGVLAGATVVTVVGYYTPSPAITVDLVGGKVSLDGLTLVPVVGGDGTFVEDPDSWLFPTDLFPEELGQFVAKVEVDGIEHFAVFNLYAPI